MKPSIFVFLLITILGLQAVPSFCQGDLNPGQEMSTNSELCKIHSITSPKGKLEVMNNLYLYDQAGNLKWKALEWGMAPRMSWLVMENNGNLSMYSWDDDGRKIVFWESGTKGHDGAYMKMDWDHYQMKVMSADGKTVLWSSPKP